MRILLVRASFSQEENFVQKNVQILVLPQLANVNVNIGNAKVTKIGSNEGRTSAHRIIVQNNWTLVLPYKPLSKMIINSYKETILMDLILIAGLFVFGCAGTNLDEEISPTELSHQSEDSLITADLTARLLRDSELGGHAIQVESTNGTVHLSGLVNNNFEAQRAEKIAKQIPGVVAVQNNLRIKLRR